MLSLSGLKNCFNCKQYNFQKPNETEASIEIIFLHRSLRKVITTTSWRKWTGQLLSCFLCDNWCPHFEPPSWRNSQMTDVQHTGKILCRVFKLFSAKHNQICCNTIKDVMFTFSLVINSLHFQLFAFRTSPGLYLPLNFFGEYSISYCP